MLTHQEPKIRGGESPLIECSSVHSPTVDSVYTYTNHKICIYTSMISVIYEQKKELLDVNKIQAFRKI